jgi:hypothetical protein
LRKGRFRFERCSVVHLIGSRDFCFFLYNVCRRFCV